MVTFVFRIYFAIVVQIVLLFISNYNVSDVNNTLKHQLV